MTPATPTAAAPIRQLLPSSSSSSPARSGNPRPSARLRLPARPRAAPSASMSAEARAAPSPVPPPAHPTYDLSAVIALALSEDAGDRGNVACVTPLYNYRASLVCPEFQTSSCARRPHSTTSEIFVSSLLHLYRTLLFGFELLVSNYVRDRSQ